MICHWTTSYLFHCKRNMTNDSFSLVNIIFFGTLFHGIHGYTQFCCHCVSLMEQKGIAAHMIVLLMALIVREFICQDLTYFAYCPLWRPHWRCHNRVTLCGIYIVLRLVAVHLPPVVDCFLAWYPIGESYTARWPLSWLPEMSTLWERLCLTDTRGPVCGPPLLLLDLRLRFAHLKRYELI